MLRLKCNRLRKKAHICSSSSWHTTPIAEPPGAANDASRRVGAVARTNRGAQRVTENSVYQIRVVSHLDPHWSLSLGGLALRHDADGTTMLEGRVRDQAALYGLLNRLRDLGLTLLTVQHLAPAASTGAPQLENGDPLHDPR
jgi:hypothetical protein